MNLVVSSVFVIEYHGEGYKKIVWTDQLFLRQHTLKEVMEISPLVLMIVIGVLVIAIPIVRLLLERRRK